MSKLKIIDKKSEKSINSERTFLAKLNHPFIVNMHYAFQDNDNLYLVMDMLSGGDLRYHISRHRKFSEEQTRFFIGCMILALEYIHTNNVIHRDIKPENLVLDEKGYVRITDFGIAKENCPDNSSETSGTPGYMSPEVMKGRNHSFEVDFFAIGVIGYEFMNGKRPYVGRNRREIKEQMIATQAKIKDEDIIPGWSNESADFINQLLIRRPENRLGFNNGAKDLKEHSWLKYYPWKELDNKQLPSPFIPEKKDNFDKRYCESVEHIGQETQMRYEEILDDSDYQRVFMNFKYNKEEQRVIKQQQQQQQLSSQKDKNSRDSNNNTLNPRLHSGHPGTKSYSSLIPPSSTSSLSSSNLKRSSTNKKFNTINVNKKSNYKFNQINSAISSSSISANKNIINQHQHIPSSHNNNNSNTNHRPLSHSYSTKDVKQIQNRNAIPQSDSRKLNPSTSKNSTNDIFNYNNNNNNHNKLHPNQSSHNLIHSLFNKLPNSNTSKHLFKNHGRSSSLTNINNKKNKEYFNKLSSGAKGKESKPKLNRADSVSGIGEKSLLRKMKSGTISHIKVKSASGSSINTMKNKKDKQHVSVIEQK